MRQLRDDGYTRVTGIDISAEAIAQCARNGVADAHEMDAQQPDFLPESFDVIAASDVLEHIADASGSLCVRIENRLICAGVHWPWSVSAMVIARNAAA
jgi:2-polyprenyl-3-methyl-5-hydroxy-6-metoxy-1,4-benzoquinol methylase